MAGCFPDAMVTDLSSQETDGIAKFKWPYSKRELTVQEACADTAFYAEILYGKLHLKRNHVCYHQVQLQLYVGLDLHQWCDFCIYTTKGIMVERISLDPDWCDANISQQESYFNTLMLLEYCISSVKTILLSVTVLLMYVHVYVNSVQASCCCWSSVRKIVMRRRTMHGNLFPWLQNTHHCLPGLFQQVRP